MSKKIIATRNLLGVSLLALLAVSFCVVVQPAFCQSSNDTYVLQAANDSVNLAFNAVLSAEKAGANVTGLLDQLNVAAGFLANAENSLSSGDVASINRNADQAVVIARQVTAEANTLEQTATAAHQNAIWFSIIFTVFGSIFFVLALFLVWRRIKKRHIEKILESKPEVVEN
jgi:hypothetical protein